MGHWGETGIPWTGPDDIRGTRDASLEVCRAVQERGWGIDANPPDCGAGKFRWDIGYPFSLAAFALDSGAGMAHMENYVNHMLGPDVVFQNPYNSYSPYMLDMPAYLAASGDSEWLAPPLRGTQLTPAKIWQWRKFINMMRWAYMTGTMSFSDDHTLVRFDHAVVQTVSYDLPRYPSHNWDIWVNETMPWSYPSYPVKVHSQWVGNEMLEGDTLQTPWLTIASFGLDYPADFWRYGKCFGICKFDTGNDQGGGFGYYDWVPGSIPN